MDYSDRRYDCLKIQEPFCAWLHSEAGSPLYSGQHAAAAGRMENCKTKLQREHFGGKEERRRKVANRKRLSSEMRLLHERCEHTAESKSRLGGDEELPKVPILRIKATSPFRQSDGAEGEVYRGPAGTKRPMQRGGSSE